MGPRISMTGGIEMVSDAQAVRQAILLLLHTTPGERVMRPEYGCGLRHLLFSPNDDTTAGLAIHLVRAALERWEPRIDIVRIDATRDPDRAEVLLIELQYRLRATQEPGALYVPLNLNGG
ncbi:hypothetical protein CR51_36265 [Caballeronia megalochromosomata]|nr:hypothetical protein CR51_36265 [Caballeronia megalochromosomata]